ncbi:hypothetical protein D3C81_1463390 [compost metagenome]
MRTVDGPSAVRLAMASNMRWPSTSRLPQRVSDAITSCAVTGVPSWNFSPGRSVKVQALLSALALYLSTICGRMMPFSSMPNRVS